MIIPAPLGWWRDAPGGAAWLERLPQIVNRCAERWSLDVGEPLSGGNVALVLEALSADGAAVVLKVSFPDEESEHEADALALWDGTGAVRLLAHDISERALLLERIDPGTCLWEVGDDEQAMAIAADVMLALHGRAPPAGPFKTLADAAAGWAETIPRDWVSTGCAFPADIVDLAVEACLELPVGRLPDVVLHQDLHGGNILCSSDRGWLAIDPKPLVGEAAFDAASLLRDRRWLLNGPATQAMVSRRLDLLVETTGLDRERMRLWGIVHALAWGVSGTKVEPDMICCAEALASV